MSERTRFAVLSTAVALCIVILFLVLFRPGTDPGATLSTPSSVATPRSEDIPEPIIAESAAPAPTPRDSTPAGTRVEPASLRNKKRDTGSGHILVHVIYGDGRPAAAARVDAAWRPMEMAFAAPARNAGAEAVADEDGLAVLHRLPDGYYTIHATDGTLHGLAMTWVQSANSLDLTITLSYKGRIAGTVATEDGSPVADASIVPTTTKGDPRTSSFPLDSLAVTSADDGSFDVVGLPSKPVRLTISAEGFATTVTDTITPDREGEQIVLTRGGALIGRTLDDATGDPVPRVALAAFAASPGGPPLRTVSDDEGAFEFQSLASGRYTVIVDDGPYIAVGALVRAKVDDGQRTECDVRLVRGARIAGRVVRGPEKVPVSGLRVAAQALNLSRIDIQPRSSGETDGEGNFLIEGLSTGDYALFARGEVVADPRRPAMVHIGASEFVEGIEIVLPATNTVVGRVVDRTGAPVAGAVVRPLTDNVNLNAISDAVGAFRLEGVAPTIDTLVYAIHQDQRSQNAGPLVFDAAGEAQVTLVLEDFAFGAIAGRVVDTSGKGVTMASLSAFAQLVPGTFSVTAMGADDGAFLIDRLLPGSYLISASAEGYLHSTTPEPIGVAEGERLTGVELVLYGDGQGITVNGKVLDKQGRPADNVDVLAMGSARWSAVTDTRGEFQMEGMYGFNVRFMVDDPEKGAVTTNYREIPESITLRLTDPPRVRGRVIDAATGEPISFFKAALSFTNPGTPVTWERDLFIAFSNPEGRFELNEWDETFATVLVVAPGYAETLVPVNRDGETVVSLTRGRRVAGHAVDSRGDPVVGASFYVGALPMEWERQAAPYVRSNESGAFVFETVDPAATLITGARSGMPDVGVPIPPNQTIDDLRVTFSSGGSIQLTFDTTGWPDGQRVSNYYSDIGARSNMAVPPSGALLIENVSAGEATVSGTWVDVPGGRLDNWTVRQPIVVTDGKTTDVTLTLPPLNAALEGIVTRNGEPIPHADVWVRYNAEGISGELSNRADANGAYIINPMPAGPSTVIAKQPGVRIVWMGDITLPEATTTHFDIDLDVPPSGQN